MEALQLEAVVVGCRLSATGSGWFAYALYSPHELNDAFSLALLLCFPPRHLH